MQVDDIRPARITEHLETIQDAITRLHQQADGIRRTCKNRADRELADAFINETQLLQVQFNDVRKTARPFMVRT